VIDPDVADSKNIIQRSRPTAKSPTSPLEALENFKKENIIKDLPRQLFSVSRK